MSESVQTIARRLGRRVDWESRLDAAFTAARSRAFQWGTHDCCLFPCDCVLAMTGVDLAHAIPRFALGGEMVRLRGAYRSLRGAATILQRYGGVEGIAERIARRYALDEVLPALAQRGDVVLLKASDPGIAFEREAARRRLEFGPGGAACLAVVGLAGTDAVAVGPAGLVELPAPHWFRAWRIP